MPAHIKVLKFGGTSVEDWAAFERVAQIVRANDEKALIVVVSAMSGVTDALLKSFRMAAIGQTNEASWLLEKHFQRHLQVASKLHEESFAKMQMLIERTKRQLHELLRLAATNSVPPLELQDKIASYGELLCANVLTMVLEQHGLLASYVDARRCILTNSEHGNASPLIEETYCRTRAALKPLLAMKRIPVLGGFVGATMEGLTTTLGRGSSDYTATLISAALGARKLQIWTDVSGVHTADPNLVKSARTVPRISYEEAAQLARLGARLIHPKMIEPVLHQKVSIQIRNSRAPEQGGTLISAKSGAKKGAIKAIAFRTDMTRIHIASTPPFVANGFFNAISEVFARHQTQMDIVVGSKVGVTIVYEEDQDLRSLVQDLQRLGSVKVERERAIVGCVGDGLHNGAGGGTNMTSVLRRMNPSLVWQSTSKSNLVAVVDKDNVRSIVRRLHQGIFE